MSWPAYPEYKDSGTDWLGPIPTHWSVTALKHLCHMRSGEFISPGDIEKEGEYAVYGGNGLRGFTSSFTHDGFFPLIGRQGALCGNVNYAQGKFWASEHAVVASASRSVDSIWLGELLRAMNLNQYTESAAQPGLSVDKVKNLYGPFPPLAEQKGISAFLTHETACIDALIEEQQRLIELLQEKRQAVISQAVTKGLHADVRMKDSGVDWIGETPQHWIIKRLWHLTPSDRQIMYGIVLPGPHFEGGIPIVKGGDVAEHKLKLADLSRTTPEIEAAYTRSRLKQGDLVYSIRGSIGEVAEIPAELEGANLTQDAARIAPTESVNGRWLLYSLQAPVIFAQLEAKAVGATIRGINIRDLKRALLPVPPPEEQIAIATFLENRLKQFAYLEQEAANGIRLMQEHRSALVSAAVTGKIDIRGWKPQDAPAEHDLPMAAEAEAQYG